MNVVKAGYELIKEQDITKKIEQIARVCYKSEDKICEGSDMKMLEMLVKRKHMAMLEHGSLAYEVPYWVYGYIADIIGKMMHIIRPNMSFDSLVNLSRIRYTMYDDGADNSRFIVSGNLRAWYDFFEFIINCDIQNECIAPLLFAVCRDSKGIIDWVAASELPCTGELASRVNLIEDWSGYTDQERMVHETLSVKFTVDRGVTHEFVRMRDGSFAQESTRYCNYSNGKFGNEISTILPCFWDAEEEQEKYDVWDATSEAAEKAYNKLISLGAQPQQARSILPTSTKADIVITANLLEWRHIFNLRACDATGPAHPQMKEVMVPLCKEVQVGNYSFAFGDLQVAE